MTSIELRNVEFRRLVRQPSGMLEVHHDFNRSAASSLTREVAKGKLIWYQVRVRIEGTQGRRNWVYDLWS